jgi:hypothetical protein
MDVATQDIEDLVGSDNMKYVQINKDGSVTLKEGYTVEEGGGSELVSKMVTSDKKYGYTVAEKGSFISAGGKKIPVDFSTTSGLPLISPVKGGIQGIQNGFVAPAYKPLSGDAELTMTANIQLTSNGRSVPRTNTVFHELAEMMLMTEYGIPRSSNTTFSAHQWAGVKGKIRAYVDGISSAGASGGAYENLKLIKNK